MSIESWKEEFYPVSAEDIAKTGTDVEIVEHSLLKWTGFKIENMSSHCTHKEGAWLVDENNESIVIGDSSCSLCVKNAFEAGEDEECDNCPVVAQSGHTCNGQYSRWIKGNNEEPMIKLLEETLDYVKGKDNVK